MRGSVLGRPCGRLMGFALRDSRKDETRKVRAMVTRARGDAEGAEGDQGG